MRGGTGIHGRDIKDGGEGLKGLMGARGLKSVRFQRGGVSEEAGESVRERSKPQEGVSYVSMLT